MTASLADFGALFNGQRPVLEETPPEKRRRQKRVNRICEMHRALTAMLSPEADALVTEFDQLHGIDLMETEDRILRIAGQFCVENRAESAWRNVFVVALDGCAVAPGHEMRFLERHRLADSACWPGEKAQLDLPGTPSDRQSSCRPRPSMRRAMDPDSPPCELTSTCLMPRTPE